MECKFFSQTLISIISKLLVVGYQLCALADADIVSLDKEWPKPAKGTEIAQIRGNISTQKPL